MNDPNKPKWLSVRRFQPTTWRGPMPVAGFIWLLLSLSLPAQSTIQFQARTVTVAETAGQVALPVVRLNDLETEVAVEFYSIDGTATAGQDFTAVSGTLSFAAGVTNQTITVPILNDALVETLERFRVALTNATGGAVLGSMKLATVSIQDNDTGPSFASSTYPIAEDVGSASIQVHWVADVEEPHTVDYATVDGTALAGTDYEAVSGTLSFAGQETLKTIQVTVHNRGAESLNKTFEIHLSNASCGTIGTPSLTTVIVRDSRLIPAFTRVTTGPISTTSGTNPMQPAWGDLNHDGFEDLIVCDVGYADYTPPGQIITRQVPQVYLNQRDGTFRRATETDIGPLATSAAVGTAVALADYDNDGCLDFYQNADMETPMLWRGGMDGRFTLVTEDVGPNVPGGGAAGGGTWGYAWGDYDRDGFVDLYLTSAWSPVPGFSGSLDYLHHNRGDGTFEPLLSPLALKVDTQYAFWADYDNDGDLDLIVTSITAGYGNFYYKNDGLGRFTLVDLPAETGWAFALGDYDNDGDLDLFGNGLFENDGTGGFTHRIGADYPPSGLAAWVDLDNNGHMELVVAPSGSTYRLFRYNPQTKRWTEEPSGLNEIPRENRNAAWADFDNDGFMDVAVAGNPNRLYRNHGNANHWVHVKPVGTRSNRSAIGARITVEAVIFGESVSQMREICATSYNQSLRAHFGLGDATEINRLIIRWPNGAREELTGIAPNQILTVVEPSVHATRRPEGSIQLQVWGNAGRSYSVQTSTDFENWTTLETVTGNGAEKPAEVTDPATDAPRQFYRVTVP